MSAYRLRQAATKLREAAEAATPGPWTYENMADGLAPMVIGGDGMALAETFDKPHLPDATYIAMMHPPVALALADWLDDLGLTYAYERGHIGDEVLTFVDAILGWRA